MNSHISSKKIWHFFRKYARCEQKNMNLKRIDFYRKCSFSTSDNVSSDDVQLRLAKTMASWQEFPYETQLQMKKDFCKRVALKLKNMLTINMGRKNVPQGLLDHIQSNEGLAFNVSEVIPSPVTIGYRNKDYAAIGPGPDGLPEVGYYIRPGKFPNQDVANGSLKIQKELHYELHQAFKEVVCKSGLPALGLAFSTTGQGHWKQCCVRSNQAGDIMLSIVMFPDAKNSNFNVCDKARDATIEFLHGTGRNFNIKSLQFQKCPKFTCNGLDAPYELLHGQSVIEETLNGCKFIISPDTFFQINSEAAEIMYDEVREMCQLNSNTLFLDVCCGTGTIGIIFGKYVKQVIGIEIIPQAVQNAMFNAQENGVENAAYICGSAEKYLARLVNSAELSGTEVVAVVNPSRSGLGENLIRALRNCEAIRKVVYISCKPAGRALLNFRWLCQPAHYPDQKITGSPFLPTDARAIDMFPHTKHFELVLLFER